MHFDRAIPLHNLYKLFVDNIEVAFELLELHDLLAFLLCFLILVLQLQQELLGVLLDDRLLDLLDLSRYLLLQNLLLYQVLLGELPVEDAVYFI